MIDQHSVHEGGRDYGAFIPSLIDDYGFDPYEYRIYCRLERRIGKGDAACFESIPNMAKACKMSRQKVRDALQVLVLAGIAKQEKQVGKTDRYILMPPAHWVDSKQLDEIRQQVTAYRQQSDAKTVAKHHQLISTELQRSCLPNYNVVDAELQRSCLPNYSVVDTELQRSCLPDYHVVDTELQRSHKGSPMNVSNEGIQLSTTPHTPQLPEKESVDQENLTLQPKEPGTKIASPSLATLSEQTDSPLQLQPSTPDEEPCPAASLVGNKTIELKRVGLNQFELIGQIDPQQNSEQVMQLPNLSQFQVPARLQTNSHFHPRSVASRDQENRYQPNQSDFPKNLDGSDRLPWDTNKRGVFDTEFENHMARSLMQYSAYRDLMAGELITKVRKHISAGRYDLKRRDELLIEWSAMQSNFSNDNSFSTGSSTLTAKGAARQAKILRALSLED